MSAGYNSVFSHVTLLQYLLTVSLILPVSHHQIQIFRHKFLTLMHNAHHAVSPDAQFGLKVVEKPVRLLPLEPFRVWYRPRLKPDKHPQVRLKNLAFIDGQF